jgi:hypothetical protein
MHIGEVLNGVYDDDIGWRPASGSIKPVHVANGLFRAVQNAHYDVGDLGTIPAPSRNSACQRAGNDTAPWRVRGRFLRRHGGTRPDSLPQIKLFSRLPTNLRSH